MKKSAEKSLLCGERKDYENNEQCVSFAMIPTRRSWQTYLLTWISNKLLTTDILTTGFACCSKIQPSDMAVLILNK